MEGKSLRHVNYFKAKSARQPVVCQQCFTLAKGGVIEPLAAAPQPGFMEQVGMHLLVISLIESW